MMVMSLIRPKMMMAAEDDLRKGGDGLRSGASRLSECHVLGREMPGNDDAWKEGDGGGCCAGGGGGGGGRGCRW